MKRLGFSPTNTLAKKVFFAQALGTALLLTACGSGYSPYAANTTSTSTLADNTSATQDSGLTSGIASTDVNTVVSGAFDQANSSAASTTSSPSNIGSLSQQQTYCTSAASSASSASSSSNFFTQITQPSYIGNTQSACFGGQVDASQLMYASYGQIQTLLVVQQLLLQRLAQTPNDQASMTALYDFATSAMLYAVSDSVSQFESPLNYSSYLGRAATVRMAAIRGARSVLVHH